MTIRRGWWVVSLSLLCVAIASLAVIAASRIPFSSDVLRRRLVEALAYRLDAQVELATLTLRFSPELHASGTGLRVRHRGRTDVPPLISIEKFTVRASLSGLWRRHVEHVKLEGLEIQIPPDRRGQEGREGQEGSARGHASARTGHPSASIGVSSRWGWGPTASAEKDGRERQDGEDPDYIRQVVIDTLEAPESRLVILRRDPAKPPRVWSMHMLKLRSVGLPSTMPFETVLTNAVPPGEITASGAFGPWVRLDPGRTPLEGRFTFERADLSVFNGISGTLSARGTFGGVLELLEVQGETSTPDFMVAVSGHKVPLNATYHAVVDGTNGNTTLDPVNATILDTSLVAQGGVFEADGVKGRIVRLDVAIDGGRLEDLMRLAVKTPKPPMTGRLNLKTTFELPPGERDVVEKLRLAGGFGIERGRFTDAGVQQKIDELSRRARGRADEKEMPREVASNFSGEFQLGKGRLALPVVAFDVPGAVVELSGDYDLRQEVIAFAGNLFMEAKLSETVTGFKSLLLKVVDPLFLREGRTVVPLKIEGSRTNPQFGLDVGRALRRGAVAPLRKPATPRPRATPPTRRISGAAPDVHGGATAPPPADPRSRAARLVPPDSSGTRRRRASRNAASDRAA